MNAADLPPTRKPEQLMTLPQMRAQVRAHFIYALGAAPDEAEHRSLEALSRLFLGGYITPWGTDEEGMMLFEPTVPKMRTVLIVKGK